MQYRIPTMTVVGFIGSRIALHGLNCATEDLIMWLLYARAPVPDAAHWPGRRLLALIDAATWPALNAAMVSGAPLQTGVVGSLVLALCALFAIRRCGRALWHNERYQFTSWRCGLPLSALLVIGAAVKLAAA